jgi:putative ABC transport system permease protein
MRIGFRKILRDLWRSKGRTLLAVVSIAIGVFAVGTVSSMSDLVPARMMSSYSETNPAHVTIYLSGIITNDDLARLAHVPGVLGVEGIRKLGARWQPAPNAPLRDVAIVIRPDYAHQKFNTIKLLSGAWPDRDGIAVERLTVDSFGAPRSGTLTLQLEEREREFKITGVVQDLEAYPPMFLGNPQFYISPEMAETVFGVHGYDQLGMQVPAFSEKAAQDTVAVLKTQLEKMGAPVYYFTIQLPNKHPLQDTINGIMLILNVMAILSLGLGLLLVINTVNAIVAQQVPQIGVMKAIGGTTRQMLLLYLSGVLVYGLLAVFIAVPLGISVAADFSAGMLATLAIPPDPVFRVSNQAIIQQLIVGLLVPLLAALWPVFSGVRLTVREAVSTYGISARYGKGLIDRLLARWRGLPRPLALILRNTFRRKGRVVLTQISLVMSGVIFIMVMSSAESFSQTLAFFSSSLGFKVRIYFQQPVRSEEAEAIIAAQPNVQHVELQLFEPSAAYRGKDDVQGEEIYLNGVPPDSQLIKLPVIQGRWLLPADDHAAVLTNEEARKLGVQIGDPIWISLGGQKIKWVVVGTVFDVSSRQRNVYVSRPVYAGDVGLTGHGTIASVGTLPDDGATQLRVESRLREALDARGLRVATTYTYELIRAANEGIYGIITSMLLALAALIALIGAIGLAGTLSINVLERRREIGVMRAIGASTPAIAGQFVGEGLLLGLLAWLIAIPLSVPVGQFFTLVMGEVLNLSIQYKFSWSGALQWLIIIVVLSILGSLLPAIRAMRVSVRESLAYE